MPEPVFMKLGMYIMAPELFSTAYFINLSHWPVCLYVYTIIVDRQRLGNKVSATTNTHATIEELLDTSFYTLSVSYKRKVADKFFQELLFFFVLYFNLSLYSKFRVIFNFYGNTWLLNRPFHAASVINRNEVSE
jgi:uncharacterized protein (DUF486 family)